MITTFFVHMPLDPTGDTGIDIAIVDHDGQAKFRC